MRRLLFILTLLSVGLLACGQTGTGWYPERKKVNFRDSTYFTKSANFLVPFRIGGTAVTSNAQELNILDGGLITYTELNNLLNSTSNIQTQLNAKQATLVSGTNIKTVNGETILGSGNIVISGEGGAMVYPGAGIPLSTGTAWGTSITNNSVQWDSAYVGRYRWSGTAIGLNAATGRTSLGGTTIGQNIFTLTNPDAIRFLRINADNTVTALSAANFKTALSFTASDVSLGNVTNESKTTMFTDPTFTGTAINAGNAFLALGTYTAPISSIRMADGQGLRWANSAWGGATSGVSLTKVSGYDTIALMGGDFMISDGDLNTTDSRVNSGYFTNLYATSLTATNAITGSITGNAATVTGFTRNSGTLTLSGGHGISLTSTGTTTLTLPTSGTLAVNPMTTAGDIVIGGTSGAPTRLAAGTAGYVLTMSGGAPAWAVSADVALEARVDSIVTVLADTMNIETLLQLDFDTDTVADLSEVRLRLAIADTSAMLANYALLSETSGGVAIGDVRDEIADSLNVLRPLYVEVADTATMLTPYSQLTEVSARINDTIDARIAAATVGVALADSNIYSNGYTTRTYVESLFGSGEGLSAKRLPFIIGVTSGAPSASDTIVVHSQFEGKHIDIYRDGAKQYQNFTTTNTVEGFRLSEDTIYVNPSWQANEQILIDIIEPILWSYLSFEGEESTLLDSLSAYWKLDETSGTTINDATSTQNGSLVGSPTRTTGMLGYGIKLNQAGQSISIPYNVNATLDTIYSFSCWIKLDSLPSSSSRTASYIFMGSNAVDPTALQRMYLPGTEGYIDRPVFMTDNTSSNPYQVTSPVSSIQDSTWYHIVITQRGRGQTLQMYLNGTDVSTNADTFSGTSSIPTNGLSFGNAGVSSFYLNGVIDEIGIWNRVLSSSEVTELYNNGNGKTYPFN